MALEGDDDVVVHGDAKGAGSGHDLGGHVDVGPGRCGIARGMVLDQPEP